MIVEFRIGTKGKESIRDIDCWKWKGKKGEARETEEEEGDAKDQEERNEKEKGNKKW